MSLFLGVIPKPRLNDFIAAPFKNKKKPFGWLPKLVQTLDILKGNPNNCIL